MWIKSLMIWTIGIFHDRYMAYVLHFFKNKDFIIQTSSACLIPSTCKGQPPRRMGKMLLTKIPGSSLEI